MENQNSCGATQIDAMHPLTTYQHTSFPVTGETRLTYLIRLALRGPFRKMPACAGSSSSGTLWEGVVLRTHTSSTIFYHDNTIK